jgi:hypothetical protein
VARGAYNAPALTFTLAITVPADTFVCNTFVAVTFTTVNVPATFRLPDKLILPPLIVDAAIEAAVAAVNTATGAYNAPDVILVAVIFGTVALLPKDSVLPAIEPALALVNTALVTVADGAYRAPDVILVPANNVVAVIFVAVILVAVILGTVALLLNDKFAPVNAVAVIVPFTSNADRGLVVPTPTLPFVKRKCELIVENDKLPLDTKDIPYNFCNTI